MVKFEYIIKAIDGNLSKSHQHLRFNKNCLPTFNKFHEETCGENPRKTEKAIITDKDGNIIFTRTDKKKSAVDIGWWEIEEYNMKTGNEVYITHNHPSDNWRLPVASLSRADMDCLTSNYMRWDEQAHEFKKTYPIKSISMESPNGSRMTIVRGDNFDVEKNKDFRKASDFLYDAYRIYKDSYNREYENIIMDALDNDSPIRQKFVDADDYEGWDAYCHKQVQNKLGRFEQTENFKNAQKYFRENNCKLTMDYPYEYTIEI